MRGVSKTLLALAVVAMFALGLSACGGGDSGDSTATTASESTATTPAQDGGSSGQGQSQGKGDDQGGSQDHSQQGSDDSSGSGDPAAEEGSAPFRTPGGDNSIQNFGEEPDETEFEAAERVATEFLEARAKSNWAGMCATLAAQAVEPLEQLAAKSPQLKGKGCAALLASVLSSTPASSRANTLTDGIASFRVQGDRGFALYHGPDGVDYFLVMFEEDGEWKVGSLAPSEFP